MINFNDYLDDDEQEAPVDLTQWNQAVIYTSKKGTIYTSKSGLKMLDLVFVVGSARVYQRIMLPAKMQDIQLTDGQRKAANIGARDIKALLNATIGLEINSFDQLEGETVWIKCKKEEWQGKDQWRVAEFNKGNPAVSKQDDFPF